MGKYGKISVASLEEILNAPERSLNDFCELLHYRREYSLAFDDNSFKQLLNRYSMEIEILLEQNARKRVSLKAQLNAEEKITDNNEGVDFTEQLAYVSKFLGFRIDNSITVNEFLHYMKIINKETKK